jgi:hypothetical protein
LICTAILALLGSFARADTQHPTPEETSWVKQYNQALVCVGLAEIIWELQKDKSIAAPIKEVGIRVSNYAIELSKNIWSPKKVTEIQTELASRNQEEVTPMAAAIFSRDSVFIQGVIFAQTVLQANAFVAKKVPDDPTRSDGETNQLRNQAAQQEFDTLNCTQVGK